MWMRKTISSIVKYINCKMFSTVALQIVDCSLNGSYYYFHI